MLMEASLTRMTITDNIRHSKSNRNAEETESMNKDSDKILPTSTAKSTVEVSNVVPQEVNIFGDIFPVFNEVVGKNREGVPKKINFS